jgi:hypothetical protein
MAHCSGGRACLVLSGRASGLLQGFGASLKKASGLRGFRKGSINVRGIEESDSAAQREKRLGQAQPYGAVVELRSRAVDGGRVRISARNDRSSPPRSPRRTTWRARRCVEHSRRDGIPRFGRRSRLARSPSEGHRLARKRHRCERIRGIIPRERFACLDTNNLNYRLPAPSFQLPATSSSQRGAGSWKPETGSRKLAAGNWKL